MTKRIYVTQEHIEAGRAGSNLSCPIALALYQQTNFVWQVSQDQGYNVNMGFKVPLPWRLRRFIRRFDAGKKVRPFSFRWM